MKSATWVAGFALGLLLLTLATAHPFAPLRKIVPLDFAGVDTIEVQGTMPAIRISSKQAAQASYKDELGKSLDVRRTGSRLLITARSNGYHDLKLSVPASVRAISVQEGANIVAVEPLQSLQVSSSDAIYWQGDIDQLELRDSADHSKRTHADCGCAGTTFNVSDGHIAELRVRSSHGELRLSKPDRIDAVYAWLGEKGGISVEKARRFDNIHLFPAEAQLPNAMSPKPSRKP